MLVKAAPGVQVPKEGKPRDYITDGDAVEVEQSAYYLRRLSDGDLIEDAEAPTVASEKSVKKGPK